MPYVAADPDSYVGKPHVGTGECVPLVEAATRAPLAGTWIKGDDVKNNLALARGTAIATFDANGRYPNRPHGNHAAIYLGQNAQGIQVIDQWRGQEPHTRTIFFGHKGASNNGDAFSVVNWAGAPGWMAGSAGDRCRSRFALPNLPARGAADSLQRFRQ